MLVKLSFQGISQILGSDDIALLLLTNEDNSRLITIVGDMSSANSILLRKEHKEISENLLPDVLWKVINKDENREWQIRIVNVVDGQYKFVLYDMLLQQSFQLRASDGILLSVISGLPIFIDEMLMIHQSVPFDTNSPRMALPVNAISDSMLQQALKKAVENENYEQASHLRDELKRRKSDSDKKVD
jgi:hypothetical protein